VLVRVRVGRVDWPVVVVGDAMLTSGLRVVG
jgi:hypothetical protein